MNNTKVSGTANVPEPLPTDDRLLDALMAFPKQLSELSRYLGHASTATTCQYYDHLAMSDINATCVASF